MPYDAKSTPRPPDWETSASGPGTWPLSSHAASNDSWPLHTPMQFGPSSTAPAARTRAATRDSTARPSSPASAKPIVMPMNARTPRARPSSTTCSKAPAGTTSTARSTGSSRSRNDATAAWPCTVGLRALTSSTRRRSEPRSTPRAMPNPHLAGSSDAPTTATERGFSSGVRSLT